MQVLHILEVCAENHIVPFPLVEADPEGRTACRASKAEILYSSAGPFVLQRRKNIDRTPRGRRSRQDASRRRRM